MTFKQRIETIRKSKRFKIIFWVQIAASIGTGLLLSFFSLLETEGALPTKLLVAIVIFLLFTLGVWIFILVIFSPAYVILFLRADKLAEEMRLEANPPVGPTGEKLSGAELAMAKIRQNPKSYQNGNAAFVSFLGGAIVANLIFGVVSSLLNSADFMILILLNLLLLSLFIGISFNTHLNYYRRLFDEFLLQKTFVLALLKFNALQLVFSVLLVYLQTQLVDYQSEFLVLDIALQVFVLIVVNVVITAVWFTKKIIAQNESDLEPKTATQDLNSTIAKSAESTLTKV